jgi:pyruvate/2-oxoglutarate dehydrogenase complex dihydrolipoamide acyltransferase (E2) component
VGLAVAAGEDLYVPVVRNADRMDLVELDRELARLVDRVRRRDLEPSDLAGGTFTVTNLGMEGIDEFSPIIAPGQTGILAVGRIRRSLEVGEGDSMAIRSVCALTAAFDHRVVNGAQAARFLAAVRREVEEPKEGEHA